jgi:adenylosuccinate lyase
MPHKKNPIVSENLCGLARLLRGYAGAGLEDVALWHERDISHSSVERVALPDATTLAHFMLGRLRGLLEGLVVHADRMRENLERSRGLVFSEGVLLALVKKGLPRQRAYEIVQRSALASHAGGPPLRELLGRDPEVAAHLGSSELDEVFDLGHHLSHVDAIFARVLDAHGEEE